MIVVPAIDLRGGRVVRLRQGRVERETVYAADPAEVARRWEGEGAERLHVVDLDAAVLGQPQPDAVAAVIAAVRIPVEVGGGLRTVEDASRCRDLGADRVIFGTAAVARPDVVREAVTRWPGAVAVAIDARDGRVAVEGWNQTTGEDAVVLAHRVGSWGVGRVQYTDVSRDGTLGGPNLETTAELARATGLRVTAAGGVSTIEDLLHLATLEAFGVDEAVVGTALYEGRIALGAALRALGARTSADEDGRAGSAPGREAL
jgi:phosphoribosylformimino-5-aminoimidazole carboxamide ribotide isomerase